MSVQRELLATSQSPAWEETPALIISRTASLWYTWVNKNGEDLSDLPEEISDLYRRSLLVVQTQCDRDGGIVAANDSDIQWGHNDNYSYMWTRDCVFVCDALDRAGFTEITRRFFNFAARIIKDEGYFLPYFGSTSAAYWRTNRVVYSIDYERGFDVVKYNSPLTVK